MSTSLKGNQDNMYSSVRTRLALLWTLVVSLTLVAADVAIVSPGQGDKFTASGSSVSITVQWNEDDVTPLLKNVLNYNILLCYGTNDKFTCPETTTNTVKPSDLASGTEGSYSYAAKFDASAVGNGQYFIQIFAQFSKDAKQYTIHYTPRFTLSSMSGTLTPSVTTTSQPATQVMYATGTTTTTDDGFDVSSLSTVPYTQQTYRTRFAPMQMQPGSTITATTWTRRFPTSAVTYYSTLRNWKSLEQLSTITPGWSYTISSDFNYATPMPFPSQNGGWYNPKSRQSLSTRIRNLKYATQGVTTSASADSSGSGSASTLTSS